MKHRSSWIKLEFKGIARGPALALREAGNGSALNVYFFSARPKIVRIFRKCLIALEDSNNILKVCCRLIE